MVFVMILYNMIESAICSCLTVTVVLGFSNSGGNRLKAFLHNVARILKLSEALYRIRGQVGKAEQTCNRHGIKAIWKLADGLATQIRLKKRRLT